MSDEKWFYLMIMVLVVAMTIGGVYETTHKQPTRSQCSLMGCACPP